MKKTIISATSLSFQLSDTTLLVLVALSVSAFHALTNGNYGFHRDELDFMMSARRLAWGYISYPPFTPFIVRLGLTLFGPSLIGLRIFPALFSGMTVFLVGLMARDLGGRRLAQVVAALAVAISPIAIASSTMVMYFSFDFFFWVWVDFCLVRLIKTEDARWWLGVGAGLGLGMMNKYTVVFLVAALAVAVLFTPVRRYLRSPWLYAGAGLALLIFLPNLIWQIQHHFIALEYLSSIHARDIRWGRADSYLPEQLYATTNPFTLPLWLAGLIVLFFRPAGKPFRALAWIYLTAFLLFLVARGRSYYVAAAYMPLLGMGAVWLEGWLGARGSGVGRLARSISYGMLGTGMLLAVVLLSPISPVGSPLFNITGTLTDAYREMVGWPELVQQVAAVYARIPEAEKPATVVLAGNYGEAGALELYGPHYGLPRIISGANNLWESGYGDPAPETVVLVGFDAQYAYSLFTACSAEGKVTNPYGVKNEESTSHTTIYVCRRPRRPWEELWQTMQWFQ
jgi:4-amino-4-deoxy-L-arabinose transferase-like glycosyltransferase